MLTLRKADDRGIAHHGWLTARHTFSFASYWDPAHVQYRALRVINEDTVRPGQGFPTHGHEDMEIVTYVLDGRLEHKDSMGSVGDLRYGDVQVMSAGTGVTHSEYNASSTDELHLLQIWLVPDRAGHPPSYREKHYDPATKRKRLQPVAAPDARDGALEIHQDAVVYSSIVEPGAEPLTHELAAGRGAWIQVARGRVEVRVETNVAAGGETGGEVLGQGDGASIEGPATLVFRAGSEEGEFLLFDMA